MEAFENIQKVWQSQGDREDLPSIRQIIKKADAMRRKSILKHIIGIVILALTFIYIFTFLFQYDFAFVTTYIGISIVLVGIVLGLTFKSHLLSILLPKVDMLTNMNEQLSQSLLYQSRLKYFYKKGMPAYFIVLTIGFGLYIYEFASRDVGFGLIAYSITTAWIIFSWFFVRRRSSKKMLKRSDEYIQLLKSIKHQINHS